MLYALNLMAVFLLGASPTVEWSNIYDWLETDKFHDVSIDSSGNIVVVGETEQSLNIDCVLMCLSINGDSLWVVNYDKGVDEIGEAVSIANDGSIVIATTTDDNMKTLLYDEVGDYIWERQSTNAVQADAIATNTGYIYVAGSYSTSVIDHNLVLTGYDLAGGMLFDSDIGTNFNLVGDISIDDSNCIIVGGDKQISCALRKYLPTGDDEWRQIYENEATKGYGLAINDANHLFQSGDVFTPEGWDFLLLKWLPSDTEAVIVWPDSTHKAYDLGHDEYCRDLAVDAISDCYLAGWQVRGEEEDVALVKTDSAGDMLWSWVYEQEGDQEIEAIEVDEDGYIYLAGSHHNGSNWDMLVMQVRQPLTISGRITDTVGAFMSGVLVKLSGDTTVEVVSDTDGFYSIEVYNGGNYVVTPDLGGWAFTPSSHTYTPLAHREFDQNFSGEYTAIEEPVTHQSDHFLEVTASSIRYVIPQGQQGIISIFDASGQLIEKVKVTGSGSVEIPPQIPSGLYVVRLVTNDTEISKKVMVR